MSAPAHLVNAARTLEQLLNELYPDRQWIVSVREDDLLNGNVPVDRDRSDPCAIADHAYAVGDGTDPTSAAGPLNEDALDQAA